MNSGNSGSLQSSNGGGDGGDGGGRDVNHPLPIHQPPSSFFNPSSFSQPINPNPYNIDPLWSRNPIYITDVQKDPNPVEDKLGVITKNPKKRTRASRRAPTTVLTTDTTNFRQMVQEFTGIPAAPFATSSSASSANFSRRLDLYGGSGMAPVVKPSAHKAQLQQTQPSYLNNNNIINNNNINVTAPPSGFQLNPLESYGITKQPLNLSSLQNQMFPFQSLSQTTQVNGTDAFVGSSSTLLKTWRGQDENMVNYEGRNGNLVNCQNVVVSNDGDQLPGNEDSWICSSD